jgi:hypothetical protein
VTAGLLDAARGCSWERGGRDLFYFSKLSSGVEKSSSSPVLSSPPVRTVLKTVGDEPLKLGLIA